MIYDIMIPTYDIAIDVTLDGTDAHFLISTNGYSIEALEMTREELEYIMARTKEAYDALNDYLKTRPNYVVME